MRKKWLAWLAVALYLALAAAGITAAAAAVPPAPTSSIYVQDYAGVLAADTKARINNVGSRLAAQTRAQVVVVTVPTIGDTPIEEYSLAILRQWGIGDKQLNNGVLMLVAVQDRQSRIEVGYGLEGALPDAKTGRLQDTYMVPYFQQGDYNRGVMNGYLALVNEVAQEYQVSSPAAAGAKAVHSAAPGGAGGSLWDNLPWWVQLSFGLGILLLLVIDWVFFGGAFTLLILSMLRRGGGGGGGGGGFGGGGFGGGSGGGGGSSRRW